MVNRWLKSMVQKFLARAGVAEFLFGQVDADATVPTQRLARHVLSVALKADKLQMPLGLNISSDSTQAPFLAGAGVNIMRGSFVTNDSLIGAYSYVGFNCLICRTNIGRYASIADGVSIGAGEHELGNISTSSIFYEDAYRDLTKDTVAIGHDAWIGTGSIVRRGVRIGIGAVVGANSFVNRDVLPYTIVAGSPARVIGQRFSETGIAEILRSQWWDKPPAEARTEIARLAALLERRKT